jgi:hypothetical protein
LEKTDQTNGKIHYLNELSVSLIAAACKSRISFNSLFMKVVEYLPLYGLIRNCEQIITVNGLTVPVKDLFTNYPEFELTADQVDQLDTFDCSSLQNILQQIYINDDIITSFLKNLLENYIKTGGSTEHWVRRTFHSVSNYSTKLRSIIELYLLNISHFVSCAQPDQSHTPPTSNTSTAISATVQVVQPAYNNLLDAFNSAAEYNLVMAILHENGYCSLGGTWQDYNNAWKSSVVSLIKWLSIQGFCRRSKLTPSEIQAICQNTFKTEKISLSTIYHISPSPKEFSHLLPFLKPGF